MRRLTSLTLVATVVSLAAAACATIGIGSYAARPLDAAAYRTWDWGPADTLPTGDPRLDNNEIFRDHLMGEIEQQLEAKGLPRVAAGATPDLRVHYHATATRRLRVHAIDPVASPQAADGAPTTMEEYEAGTIVIDFVDPRTNRLVWRGWAEDTIDNMIYDQPQLERHVDRAVTKLFARLPFGRR